MVCTQVDLQTPSPPGCLGRENSAALEVRSSSREMAHVSQGRLQQQRVQTLRQRRADPQQPDGVSLLAGSAAGEGTEEKQAGRACAPAAPLHGLLLPAESDEALKVHGERPSEIHPAQYTLARATGARAPTEAGSREREAL